MAEEYYKQTGAYYGYPECCIESFLSERRENGLVVSFSLRSEAQQKTAKNGFIPCLRHAEQILSKKIKIEDLISPSRQCCQPFSKPERSLGKYQHCTGTPHCSPEGRTPLVAEKHFLLG